MKKEKAVVEEAINTRTMQRHSGHKPHTSNFAISSSRASATRCASADEMETVAATGDSAGGGGARDGS